MKSLKRLLCFVVAMTAMTIGAFAQAQDTYTVAGSPEIAHNWNWDPTCSINDMTLQSGTTYQLVVSCNSLTAGDYEFKIVKNHDWDEGSWPANNYVLHIPSDGSYTITYTFDSGTKAITVDAFSAWTVVGSATGSDAGGISDALFGTSWAPTVTANDMNIVNGTYSLNFYNKELSTGTVKYKIVKNHVWDEAYPSSNAELTIPYNGTYNVTFTFNPLTHEVSATAVDARTPKVLWLPDANGGTNVLVYDTKDSWYGQTYEIDGISYTVSSVDNISATPSFNSNVTTIIFDESFQYYQPTDLSGWFSYKSKLTTFRGLENFDTSRATTMKGMFTGCDGLTSLDLSTFDTSSVTDMSSMFIDCDNLETLNLRGFDTSNVTDMNAMFNLCKNLTSVDLSTFNTSNVENMSWMFASCYKLTSLDLSTFDTSNVKDMSSMFGSVYLSLMLLSQAQQGQIITLEDIYTHREDLDELCMHLTNLTLGQDFDTSNVEKMDGMFIGCKDLNFDFLSSFDTSSVTDMTFMFAACFNIDMLDLTSFNISNLEKADGMFAGCVNLTQIICHDDWNQGPNVPHSTALFYGCPSLVGDGASYDENNANDITFANPTTGYFTSYPRIAKALWLSGADNGTLVFVDDKVEYTAGTSTYNINGTDYTVTTVYPFTEANSIRTWEAIATSVKKVLFDSSFANARPDRTDEWFSSFKNMTSIVGLTYLNTSRVTNMYKMFQLCEKLSSLDLSNFNTAIVGSMEDMFSQCNALTSLDLSSFKTSNVTTMDQMFGMCEGLSTLDLSGFETSNLLDMGKMFTGCTGLSSIDLSSFDTSKVTDMQATFANCSNLASLDLSNFNTSNVTSMAGMFYHCSQLTTLDLNSFSTAHLTTMSEMFNGCSGLTTIYCAKDWSNSAVTAANSEDMFAGCTVLTSVSSGKSYDANDVDINFANPTTGYFTAPKTSKALWLPDAETLVFVYENVDYEEGVSTYDINGTSYTVAKIYDAEYGEEGAGWREQEKDLKKVIFAPSFSNYQPTNIEGWFYSLDKMTTIEGMQYFDTSLATSMHNLFYDCEALLSLDLSYLNTSNVTNMKNMFADCSKLVSLNVSNFDTSKVTDMSGMFANCSGLTTLDVSQFNTALVTNMSEMFVGSSGLTTLNVNNFSVVSLTETEAMFAGCTSLQTIYCSNDWKTLGNVSSSGYMFDECTVLTSISSGISYNSSNTNDIDYANPTTGYFTTYVLGTPKALWIPDADNGTLVFVYDNTEYTEGTSTYEIEGTVYTITNVHPFNETNTESTWSSHNNDVKIVRFDASFVNARPDRADGWFGKFRNLTSVVGIDNFNTSAVTSMRFMFEDCESLTNLDLSSFNTANVTNMRGMFSGCKGLESLVLSSSFNTANVTDMHRLFESCSRLTSIDLSNFNTAEVTDMSYMFYKCESLTSLNVSSFNTAKVTNMCSMFRSCGELQEITGLTTSTLNTNFVTANVTDMGHMFEDDGELLTLDVTNFNTEKVTNMYSLFDSCSALEELDVTSFNTSNVTDMNKMFFLCEELKSIDITGFDTKKVTDMRNMFAGCTNLPSIKFGANFSFESIPDSKHRSNMFFDDYMLRYVDFSACPVDLIASGENVSRAYTLFTYEPFDDLADTNNIMGSIIGFTFESTQEFCDFVDSVLPYVTAFISQFDNEVSGDIGSMFFKSFTPATVGIFTRLPETTVVYLPNGSNAITNETNIVYTDTSDGNKLKCPYYKSIDMTNIVNVMYLLGEEENQYYPLHHDVELPYAFQTNKAEYTRTMSNTYGSVVLPYDFTSNADIQAFTLDEKKDGKDVLVFKDAATVSAHTPFAFEKKGNAEFIMEDNSFGITVNATRDTAVEGGDGPYTVNTNVSGWTAIGFYENQFVDKTSGTYYYVASDKVYKATGTGNLTLYPHRVIFQSTDQGSAKMFGIETVSGDDIVNAIKAADTEKTLRESDGIFDMQGRQQNSLHRGVNIVRMGDGTTRKVVIK